MEGLKKSFSLTSSLVRVLKTINIHIEICSISSPLQFSKVNLKRKKFVDNPNIKKKSRKNRTNKTKRRIQESCLYDNIIYKL